MKVQGSDLKTSTDLGGDTTKLVQDTQIYVKGASLNKTLNQAITDGNMGGSPVAASVVDNTSTGTVGSVGQTFAGHTLTLANEPGTKSTENLALYKFETLLQDETGTYGLTNSGAVQAPGIFGITNTAMYLNGSSYMSQATLLDTIPDKGIAIDFWFKADNGRNSTQYLFDMQHSAGAPFNQFLAQLNGSGQILLYGYSGTNNPALTAQTVLPSGQTAWYYFCCNWDAINGCRLWINGVLEASSAISTTLPASGTTYDFCIGKSAPTASAYIAGAFAQFRIRNKILTQDDVDVAYSSLYNISTNESVQRHGRTSSAIYQLPSAAAVKRFTFQHRGITGTSQYTNKAIIAPAAGDNIIWRNNQVVNPGFLTLNKPGSSITLVNLDTDNWVVERISYENHEKNAAPMGNVVEDVSLVGRDSWVTKGNLTTPTQYHGGWSLDGYGYVVGGADTVTSVTFSATQQYNDATNIWTLANNTMLDKAVFSHFPLNGKGFVTGGSRGSGSFETGSQYYTPSTNVWTTIADSHIRRFPGSGFTLNGYGYAGPGYYTGVNYSYVDQYNDSTNVWNVKANSPQPLSDATCASLNGYGYIIAGYNDTVGISNIYQYNDSANSWLEKKSYLIASWDHYSPAINGGIFTAMGNGSLTNAGMYNDGLNIWTAKTPSSFSRTYTSSFSLGGYGYFPGGQGAGVANSETFQYN